MVGENCIISGLDSPDMVSRMRWTGHVARTGEKKHAQKVVAEKREGKRLPELSRLRRECNIKVDLKKTRKGRRGLDEFKSG
jgi:hypothetical protein